MTTAASRCPVIGVRCERQPVFRCLNNEFYMKTLTLLTLGSLFGWAITPDINTVSVAVPIGGTDSDILGASRETPAVRFLGMEMAAESQAYADFVLRAVQPEMQDPVPAPPRSALPSSLPTQPGTFFCSSGTGRGFEVCSTDATQTICSVNGNEADGSGHSCSSSNIGGKDDSTCSANAGDASNKCSVHGALDNACSAMELPGGEGGGTGTARCSAFDAGFCSVFAGGGAPGPGGGGTAGGKDNSCSAFGKLGETPKCSAFANLNLPLCSVLKDQTKATCTVVDSETYGKGAGTCSTMNSAGVPIGPPPVLCSIIDMSTNPPGRTGPVGKPPRCTTTKVE